MKGITYCRGAPGEGAYRILRCVLIMVALSMALGCNKKGPSGREPGREWLEGELDIQPIRLGGTPWGLKSEAYYLICKGRAYELAFGPDCAFANMDKLGESDHLVPIDGKGIPVHDGARYRAKGLVSDIDFDRDGSRAVHTHDGKSMPLKVLLVTRFELVSSGNTGRQSGAIPR